MHTNQKRPSPTISVIIPTLNAGADLEILLQRLWDQTLPPIEIIVVDSSSTDGTAELAAMHGASVHSIDRADYDHGGTRNFGASLASGELLVFMTQDAIPADDRLLANLIKPLKDDLNIAYSFARQIAKSGAKLLEQLSRLYNYPPVSSSKSINDISALGIKTFFCSNVCSAIRRDVFQELGQFPAPVIFNEDLFFAAKCVLAQYSISYAAEAVVLHSHNYSLRQQFKRFFDNGVSMRMNEWILPYSSVNRVGSNLLRFQFYEIAVRNAWQWIPSIVGEALVKYAGLQLGQRYHRLPDFLCKRFSMHRTIWERLHTGVGSGTIMKE